MKSAYWVLAGVLFGSAAHAIPHYGPGMGPGPYGQARMAAQAQAMATPAVALRTGMDRLQAFLGGENKPSAEELASFLDTEIAPFFDFEYMAEAAGGRQLDRMSDEQRAAVVAQIKQSFLGKMAQKLGGYTNQRVRFMPPRLDNGGRTAQVSAAVLNPGSYPARLDFRLYRKGGEWLVYDVAANGQSAIVHYRNQLTREMRQMRMRQMRQMTPPPRPQMPQRMLPPRQAPMPPR